MESHALHSSFREKALEHVFIGECLRRLWSKGVHDAEVLRAEVDGAGYDLVIEVRGVLRHIQLKASYNGSATSRQTVNEALTGKPSGCIVWMGFDVATLGLGPFLWFGGEPNEPLPPIDGFSKARHTKADSKGQKGERRNSRVLPKSAFEKLATFDQLIARLFGPLDG